MKQVYRVFPKNTKSVVFVHSVFALIAVLLFTSTGLQAQAVVDLGALPSNYYSSSSAWAINNDGVIVGAAVVIDITGVDTTFTYHAVKWQNGQISSIYSSEAYGDVNVASDVNSLGNAAGTIEHSGYPLLSAARWQGGSVEILPVIPDYAWSNGYGINDSGWIVGYDYYRDTVVTHTWGHKAFLWKGSTVTILPDLNADGWSYAKKVNNNGIIVGYSTLYGGSPYCWNGCAWFNGKIYTLPPAAGYYQSFAFDINDSNTIVGISDPGFETYEGVVTTWKVTIINGTDLQISAPVEAPLDYRFNVSYEFPGRQVAINNLNTVVGTGVDTLSDSTVLFVYKDGVFGNLSDVVTVLQFGTSSFTNKYGIDINDSGQIVGVARFGDPPVYHGFLLAAKYLGINKPAENDLLIAGDSAIISWIQLGVDSIKIYYLFEGDTTKYPITTEFLADWGYYVWDIPETFLSTGVKIRIEDASSEVFAESGFFRVKPIILTRLNDEGDYDLFRPEIDGWQMLNTGSVMWPSSYWQSRFNYSGGNDPNTGSGYPQESEYPFLYASDSDWVDWPVLTETFGVNRCYIAVDGGGLEYRREATDFWNQYKGNFQGCCAGLAQSSILAFENKEGFLTFSGLPDFGIIYGVPVSDTTRKVIHRLYTAQLGAEEDAYHITTASKTAVDVLSELKAILLSDANDPSSLSLYSHNPPGGHTMVPYRVIKDPGNPAAYRIYTYDSNNPGDTGIFIVVDTVANRWTFGDLGWSGNMAGSMILDRPASNYKEQQHFTLAAKANSNSDYMQILNSDAKDIQIFGTMGESVTLDSINGITISGPLVVWPIIPPTGGPHRPIGFYMPRPPLEPPDYYGAYGVNLSKLAAGDVHVSFRTDSLIWNYFRHHADSTQSDYLAYLESSDEKGLVAYYGDEGDRTVDVSVIIPGDDFERSLDVTILKIVPGNSIRTSYLQEGDFTITNNGFGFPTYCNLRLSQISAAGVSKFNYDSLYLEGETRYTIHQPNWDSLDTAPLKILIAHYYYGYGTIDDSVILNSQPSDVDEPGDLSLPRAYSLSQNFPNPFNPTTTIEYSLPRQSNVSIEIFDILGRRVRQLVDETKSAGIYKVMWDGTDQSGIPVATGMYLYQVQAGDFIQTKKMLLLK